MINQGISNKTDMRCTGARLLCQSVAFPGPRGFKQNSYNPHSRRREQRANNPFFSCGISRDSSLQEHVVKLDAVISGLVYKAYGAFAQQGITRFRNVRGNNNRMALIVAMPQLPISKCQPNGMCALGV